jgi:hypothetical protein
MSLILIEGSRKSGKSYLISKQNILPVFKFPFNENFSEWDFDKSGTNIHWFGLGKEVMLHELDNSGKLPKMLVDRGILTNSVWGVFQRRISVQQAKTDLVNFYNRGLFSRTKIVLVEGLFNDVRKKDIWDSDDDRREEEYSLFQSFSLLLSDLGVTIHTFHNNFDNESINQFNKVINNF